MAFNEDLDIYFADFSDDVIYDGIIYKGIFEQPDEMIADGIVLTTDYELTAKNSDLGSLAFDTEIDVSDITYKVRNIRKIDDGTLCKISLTKKWYGNKKRTNIGSNKN